MDTKRVQYLREEKEVTQVEIALALGCSRSSYSLWEIGKDNIPLKYLIKTSNYLKVNLDYLVDLTDDRDKEFIPSPEVIDKKLLGQKIRLVRKRKNITQTHISKSINTTQSTISAYEAGKTRVTTSFLVEFAKLTNTSLTYLLNGEPVKITEKANIYENTR